MSSARRSRAPAPAAAAARRGVPSLWEMLGEISREAFFARYWPSAHLVTHGSPSRLGDLIRELSDAKEVLASWRRWPAATRVGAVFRTAGGRIGNAVIDARAAADLYARSFSISLVGSEHAFPAIRRTLHRFGRDLDIGQAGANCTMVLSPRGSGFETHFDSLDVFVLQVAGTKRWQIAPNAFHPFPTKNHVVGAQVFSELADEITDRRALLPPRKMASVELRPGSMLYLPRGYWHRTASGGDSISISLSFPSPTGADLVLAEIRRQLLRVEAWREPVAGGPAARRRRVRTLLARMADDLAQGAQPRYRRPLGRIHIARSPGGRAYLRNGRIESPLPAELEPLLVWAYGRTHAFTADDAARALRQPVATTRRALEACARAKILTLLGATPAKRVPE